MFIGEAPGSKEDEQGLPFVGPVSRTLEDMCAKADKDFKTEDCYISNACRCKPFQGSEPSPPDYECIETCRYIMAKEIELVKPRLLITLGKPAILSIMPEAPASLIMREYVGRQHYSSLYDLPVFCMYHPSYVDKKKNAGFREEWIFNLSKALAFYQGLEALDEFISGRDKEEQRPAADFIFTPASACTDGALEAGGSSPGTTSSNDFTQSDELEGIDRSPVYYEPFDERDKEACDEEEIEE